MFYVIYSKKSQGYATEKFHFQTSETVNVPVMTSDGVQAFVGAVCMLGKGWFVAVLYWEFGRVHPVLHQELDGANGRHQSRRVMKQHLTINTVV